MMMGSKKGQSAVEALVYVGFFLFISVFIALFFILQQGQDLTQIRYKLGAQTAGQISDAIVFASLAGPGFKGTFYIPPDILGSRYTVNLTSTGAMYVMLPSNVKDRPDTTYYYPLGRGNFEADHDILGSGSSYYGSSNVKAVWFDTSKGWMNISVVNDTAKGGVLMLIG